jgi:molybdopterin converting factor subunit 1
MRVLLFAHLKDHAGRAEFELSLPGPTPMDELWRRLLAVHPELAPFRDSVRLARNGEYVDKASSFVDTDEVALIPPVSGG